MLLSHNPLKQTVIFTNSQGTLPDYCCTVIGGELSLLMILISKGKEVATLSWMSLVRTVAWQLQELGLARYGWIHELLSLLLAFTNPNTSRNATYSPV